jgi:mannose-6-phosphate isomerase-like protein (cupin superfamily)
VLAGAVRTRVAGAEGALEQGEMLEIPRGTLHQMWNAGQETAVMRWETRPAGRTLDWFREIAALQAGEEPLGDPTTLLERYGDTVRLERG